MELEALFYGEVGVATWATGFDWSLLLVLKAQAVLCPQCQCLSLTGEEGIW